jgi:hypothetical protein
LLPSFNLLPFKYAFWGLFKTKMAKVGKTLSENTREYRPLNNDAPIGTYATFYIGNDHTNYLVNLEIIGVLLISILREEEKMRVLLRSVIGIKEYFYQNEIVGCYNNVEVKLLQLSIDRYFREIINPGEGLWQSVLASRSVIPKKKKSFIRSALSRFFEPKGFLKVDESTLSKESQETTTLSSLSSGCTAEERLENIKSSISLQADAYEFKNIFHKIVLLNKKYNEDIMNLDETSEGGDIAFDVLLDKSRDSTFLYSILGNKIEKEEYILMKHEKKIFSHTEKELKDFKLKHKDSENCKFFSVKEFIETEINYYKSMKEAYEEIIIRLSKLSRVSVIDMHVFIDKLFGAFIKIYEFEEMFLEKISNQCMRFESFGEFARYKNGIERLSGGIE